jgi:hypothetical protein
LPEAWVTFSDDSHEPDAELIGTIEDRGDHAIIYVHLPEADFDP